MAYVIVGLGLVSQGSMSPGQHGDCSEMNWRECVEIFLLESSKEHGSGSSSSVDCT